MVKLKRSKLVSFSDGSSNGIDRISNLPDPILSDILSLLPTKEAVATAVLSIRWKFLWTFITNLDFHYNCCSGKNTRKGDMEQKKFANFVNRVLLLLNPPTVQKFRLNVCCQDCVDPSYLNSWILAGFRLAVCKFSLYLYWEEFAELPLSQIYCNVAVLKLGCIHFNIPTTISLCFPSLQALYLRDVIFVMASDSCVSFPNLKIMNLNRVVFENEESVHKLLSSSPVLDNLIIKDASYDDIECLSICSPSLTSLSIDTLDLLDYYDYELKINAPALMYLNVNDFLPREYIFLEDLSSLIQANVRLFFRDNDDVNVESCIGIIKFIGKLSQVKFLSVSGDVLKAFMIVSESVLSGFHNLKWLEIEVYNCLDFSMMINSFLLSMKNLEHLIIVRSTHSSIGDDICYCQSWWIEPVNVPECMQSRLTTVSFSGSITGCCDQLMLIRYILKNANVLQLLTIDANLISQKQPLELLRKISLFPKGSETCQVGFT